MKFGAATPAPPPAGLRPENLNFSCLVYMWKYSLKYSLRSLFRELVRNVWARKLVYPALLANERAPAALAAYIRARGQRQGFAAGGDGTTLPTLAPGAALMSKIALKADPARYTRKRRLGSLIRSHIRTSGTSGSPLTLVQNLGCVVREEAFFYRQLRWIGFRHGQRRAWIRGDIVCPPTPADGVYWCHDWIGKMLMMSSYHISPSTIPAYLEQLERFDPVVIHAYPSSIAVLAAWMKANGRGYRGKALLGVTTSSETLDAATRANVRAAFGVPTYDWYGQAERVAAIATCEHGNYHVLSDYSAVELLPVDGALELVGSGYNNAAMKLERYRTGDTVTVGAAAPCPCGRVFPVVQAILGRKDKVITLPDGRHITRLGLVFQGIDSIIEGQVVYLGDGAFTLRVVVGAAFTDADAQALAQRFLQRVPGVTVRVDVVGAIPRGPNGKFAFIVVPDPR